MHGPVQADPAFYNGAIDNGCADLSTSTPSALDPDVRWGTNWGGPDKFRETERPIDDTDMGCDCEEEFPIREAWTRQIDLIEIDDERDTITDNGQEPYNLLAQHGIENVILMGVHLHMCVLGRPVGIRQMVNLGKNVVLMRDMTDTMYNPKKRPFVSHFEGTDLVVKHVEKFWCPSITSTAISDKAPFRFKNDPRK